MKFTVQQVGFAVTFIAMFCVTPHLRSQQAPAKETQVYKKVAGRELTIHISKPKLWNASDSRPAVVFFHGGGWVGGKPGQFDAHCEHLTKHGLVCFQVQYRLLNKPAKKKQQNGPQAEKPTLVDRTPTRCIHDAKSAMRWVRSRASEFGINPSKIATAGGSAGGHLAAFLGTTDGTDDPNDDQSIPARANAMILFNPVYDNGPGGWGTSRVGQRFQEFSPAHNISKDDVPSIVFLGTNDKLIPIATAQRFQQKMQSVGIKSDLRLYAGASHGFFNTNKEDGKWYPYTIDEMDEFLRSLGWLK